MAGIDSGPPNDWVLITPHDTNAIVGGCRAILVGGTGGAIVARLKGSTDRTLTVTAGQMVPGTFLYVRSTGTTATTLHAGV